MSDPNPPAGPTPPAPGDRHVAKFDPSAPHQQRPRLRPIRGFGFVQEGRQVLGLADARQLSEKVVFTSPAAQAILPHMTGENDLNAIVDRVNDSIKDRAKELLSREILEVFVAQLDEAALIEGPKYEALLKKVREDFDSQEILPPAVTANFADALVQQEFGEKTTDEQKSEHGPAKLRAIFDEWIKQALSKAPDPSFDALPKAIIAPHLDYGRGWLNYAHTYGRMRVVDRPDRVIILGTNHFGSGTGVTGCDKGFQTPLGTSPIDEPFAEMLKQNLGADYAERLFRDRYDHEREHSIELHIAWIQHVFGPGPGAEDRPNVPVFAALVHDPAVRAGESYDAAGLALQPFIDALKKTIDQAGGRTLVVASADLSHVGPQFGDKVKLNGDEHENPDGVQARNKAIQHDRAMLDFVHKNKPDDLVAAMAWQRNPTRWCSVGNLVATLKTVEPKEVRLLHYAAAMDPQGMAMVSSCAAAMF